MKLHRLPLEIYTIICQHLFIEDIKQFTLTCQSVELAVTPELFCQRQVTLTSINVSEILDCTIRRRPLLHYIRSLYLELTSKPETLAFEQMQPSLKSLGHVHIKDLSGQNFDWFWGVATTSFFQHVGVSFDFDTSYGVDDRLVSLLENRDRQLSHAFRLIRLNADVATIQIDGRLDDNFKAVFPHANEVHAEHFLRDDFEDSKYSVWRQMLLLASHKLVLETDWYKKRANISPPAVHRELQSCDFGANLTVLKISYVGIWSSPAESTLTINSSGLRYLDLQRCFRWIQGTLPNLIGLYLDEVTIKDYLHVPKLRFVFLAFYGRGPKQNPPLFDQCLSAIKRGPSKSRIAVKIKTTKDMFSGPESDPLVDPGPSLRAILKSVNDAQAWAVVFECSYTYPANMCFGDKRPLKPDNILTACQRIGAAARSNWDSLERLSLTKVYLGFDVEIGSDIMALNDTIYPLYDVEFKLYVMKLYKDHVKIRPNSCWVVVTTAPISLTKLHSTIIEDPAALVR